MSGVRWVPVMSLADLAEGEVGDAVVDGQDIAIYHLPGGEVCATSNVCTHGQALLSEGWIVEDCQIECPLHGGCFDIRTGRAVGPPAEVDLETFEVRTSGGTIEVGIPE